MTPQASGKAIELLQLHANQPPPPIHPHSFFIAWHGVLTLAFRSWPTALIAVKQSIAEHLLPNHNEAFGSRWPKISLAYLQDDAPPLDEEQFSKLNVLCQSYRARLATIPSISLLDVSAVMFASRNLENIWMRIDVPFVVTVTSNSSQNEDSKESSSSSPETSLMVDPVVESVLSESSSPEYFSKVSAPGHRASHYEKTWTESTIVSFVRLDNKNQGHELCGILKDFREEVEALLPGCYRWAAVDALHVTLRCLEARGE